MESFVDDLTAKHSDARFILWLGDNPDNGYYDIGKERHRWIFGNATKKLMEKHPHLGDVYPVVGNHEGLPIDNMNMDDGQEHWPIDYLADLWSPWFTAECTVPARDW